MQENFFVKSHGLGNDYIVIDQAAFKYSLSVKAIKRICDVHYGIGSDGILLKVPSVKAQFGLVIYNPDGSEAEKSGNGLRIFCKFLYDYGFAKNKTFTVETKGGIVNAIIDEELNGKARIITIDMGKAIFESSKIPVKCEKLECIDVPLQIEDKVFHINCVSVGNPHCVILRETLDVKEIKKYGTIIENNLMFPERINVQFVKVLSRKEVQIEIWERGAGYTLASGSSSCAVASMMIKKGLVDKDVTMIMPGGKLKISVNDNWEIRMTGEVRQIAEGVISNELIKDLEE